jgi:hypothetical protein
MQPANFEGFFTTTLVCVSTAYEYPALSSTLKTTTMKTLLYEIAKIINPKWREYNFYQPDFDEFA